MSLPLIPQDKANHVVYGAAIAAVGVPLVGLWAALIACFVVAVGKEILYDHFHQDLHTVDPMDSIATFAGGLVVALSHIHF